MPDELEFQKLKKEYPEFFEQVSPKLLEFILSEETSSKIAQICLENGVEDEEKIEKIAYQVTLALLGQTPKENLAKILEKGVKLDSEIARKVHIEVNRLIFSRIQKIQPGEIQKKRIQMEKDRIEKDEIEKKSEKPTKKDVYREPIK